MVALFKPDAPPFAAPVATPTPDGATWPGELVPPGAAATPRAVSSAPPAAVLGAATPHAVPSAPPAAVRGAGLTPPGSAATPRAAPNAPPAAVWGAGLPPPGAAATHYAVPSAPPAAVGGAGLPPSGAAAALHAFPSAPPAAVGGAGIAPRHAAAVRAQSCAVPGAHPGAFAGVRLVAPHVAQWAHGRGGPGAHRAAWGDAAHHGVVGAQHCAAPSWPQGTLLAYKFQTIALNDEV